MDNKTAFTLALALVVIFAADHFYFDWGLPTIFGKLLASFSEWLAFWR